MEALHQTQLNSFLLSKIKFVLIFSALFLSSNFIVSGIFAKEEILYVKGLGTFMEQVLDTLPIRPPRHSL